MIAVSHTSSHLRWCHKLLLATPRLFIMLHINNIKPAIERVQGHSLTFRLRCKASLNLTWNCAIRVRVRVSFSGCFLDSINVDRYAFALQRRPVVLYTYMYVVMATKFVYRLQIRPMGQPLPFPKITSGSVQQCKNAARDRQTHTHRQTDGCDRYAFRFRHASGEM